MWEGLKATVIMIGVQFLSAGTNICYKLASNDGMKMNLLISYRYFISSILIFPFAFFFERNKRPKLTWMILFQAFLCALLGGPLAQNLYAESLVLTSATFAAAFNNLLPPFTFVFAALFGLERVGIGSTAGRVKVVGTLVGVGGAMILTFYKGQQINTWSTHLNILHDNGQHMDPSTSTSNHDHHIIGSVLALVSTIFTSLFLTLQAKLSANYPCHCSNTFLITVMGFIQSLVFSLCTERSWTQWKLARNIRLFAVLFMGASTVLSNLFSITSIHLEGPLFVSAFNPLTLVYVAIAGFLVLDEKLHVGTVLGSVVVVVGLYMVLWGKSKEKRRRMTLTGSKDVNDEDNN